MPNGHERTKKVNFKNLPSFVFTSELDSSLRDSVVKSTDDKNDCRILRKVRTLNVRVPRRMTLLRIVFVGFVNFVHVGRSAH